MSADPMFGPFFWGVMSGFALDLIPESSPWWIRIPLRVGGYVAAATVVGHFFVVVRT